MSRMDERWEASKQELVEAARNAGVDAAIVAKIAGFESGYNPTARPISSSPSQNRQRQFDGVMAISSGYGYGQFLDGTWQAMLNQHGERYGVVNASRMTKSEANAPALRADTRLQAAMLAEFTRANVDKGLRLGGTDADANVYAFHNLGDGDATKLLNALRESPNARTDSILSARVIAGNPALYGDGSRTVTEAYQAMGKAMDKYEKYAAEAVNLSVVPTDPLNEISQIGERIKRGEPIYQSSLKDGLPDFLRVDRHAPPLQHDAMRDGKLQRGESGHSVETLQERLNDLGIRDGHGRKLAVDGAYGRSTHEAVENFQLWQGLETSGIADRATLERLQSKPSSATIVPAVQRQTVAPTHPSHPDHAMLEQIRNGVRAQDAKVGEPYDEASERISRSLLAACKDNRETWPDGCRASLGANALSRVDHVVIGNKGHIFAVEGRLDDPAHKLVSVPVTLAMRTPVEQSDEKLHVANQAITQERAAAQQTELIQGLQEPGRAVPVMQR